MEKQIDIIKIIEGNPLRLSGDYKSNMISMIQNEFKTEEEKLFVAGFYCYLNYDDNEFIVVLETIWKWIGYSRIEECKRVLIKHFKENIDYKIENFAPPIGGAKTSDKKIENRGGHNKENILITVDCFKKICMKSKTKKADEIHDYYLKLEKILQKIVKEESEFLRNALTLKDREIGLITKQMETVTRKKVHKKEKKDTIYLYKQNQINGDNKYKIGKTKYLTERETTFITSNYEGEMVYSKQCINSDLAEKVVHFILDKHRIINRREWFNIDYDSAVQTIDAVVCFLDDFVDVSEQFGIMKIADILKNHLNEYKMKEIEETEVMTEVITAGDNVVKKIPEHEKILDIISKNNNPLDYDKFIEDNCIIGEEFFCIKKEVYGQFKLWSRTNNQDSKEVVRTYFENNFKSGKHFFEEYNSTLAVYKGFKLKPFIFKTIDHKLSNFIEKIFIFGPIYRVDTKTIETEYSKYIKRELTIFDKNELREYLSINFYPSCVYLSDNNKKESLYGYWGLKMKDNINNIGLKIADSLKKQIFCINIKTKEIEHTFDSVTSAGRFFGVHPSNISTDIRYNRIRNGYILYHEKNEDCEKDCEKKNEDCEILDNLKKNDMFKKGIVYKIDVSDLENIKILNEFKNISKACENENIARTKFSLNLNKINEHIMYYQIKI